LLWSLAIGFKFVLVIVYELGICEVPHPDFASGLGHRPVCCEPRHLHSAAHGGVSGPRLVEIGSSIDKASYGWRR
jgi:hypothetical protein